MKRIMLALVVILALASTSFGSTFANFCDTEMVVDSGFTTGDLDLKVARAGDPAFYDDQPYGTGLFLEEIEPGVFEVVPCFQAEEDSNFADSYTRNFRLWNAGTAHGRAYVHIRGVGAQPLEHAVGLLDGTNVTLWYDLDEDGDDRDNVDPTVIDEAEVVTGTLGGLDCQPVPEPAVWLLPANELRNLQIVIDPPAGAPGDSLAFHIQFNLVGFYFDDDDDMVGVGFCDTEICLDNCLEVKE